MFILNPKDLIDILDMTNNELAKTTLHTGLKYTSKGETRRHRWN